jgi:hypothetical protein
LTAAWISKLPAPQPRISPSFLLFRTHICCFLDRTLLSCFKSNASGLSALAPYFLLYQQATYPGANCTNLTSQISSIRPCTIRRQTLFSDGSTSRVQPCRSSASPQININIHCVSFYALGFFQSHGRKLVFQVCPHSSLIHRTR